MKLKLPKPVVLSLTLPTGDVTVEYSARELITHVVRTGALLGASNELEKVQMGARILSALGSGDETDDIGNTDLEVFRTQLRKPTRGWSSVPVRVPLPTGRVDASGNHETAERVRYVATSPIDLLPLINPLLG